MVDKVVLIKKVSFIILRTVIRGKGNNLVKEAVTDEL